MERKSRVYVRTLLLLAVLVLLMNTTSLSVAFAAEDIWTEQSPRGPGHPPSPERIDRMLKRIAEENPERAKELRQLRKNDPEQFDKQFHREMQTFFEKHGREHRRPGRGDQERRPNFRGPGDKTRGHGRGGHPGERDRGYDRRDRRRGDRGPGAPGERGHERGGRGHSRRWEDQVQQRHEDFIKWFEENYPEKAKKLIDSRQKDPDRYMRSFMAAKDKYGDIMKAQKKNPKLAKVLAEDLELKQKCDKLVRQLKSADADERPQVLAKLQDTVAKRFDLIIKKKQFRYQGLKKKLAKIKTEVEKRQAELDELVKTKQQAVAERVNELAGKSEKINWD